MNWRRDARELKTAYFRAISLLQRFHGGVEPKRPIFIVGCGRSGTTILGQTIAQHASVAFLNEPRHIWHSVFPEGDIWSRSSRRRGGRLELGAEAADERRARRLRFLFGRYTKPGGDTRVLEKLPINVFRITLLAALFPDARFVHLVRDGRAVARSIARRCEVGSWYGWRDSKWRALEAYAATRAPFAELLPLCTDNYHRGLLEWRLSVDAGTRSLNERPSHTSLVRYEEFTQDPVGVARRLENALGLRQSNAVAEFAGRAVRGDRGHGESACLTVSEDAIAGAPLREFGYLQ